MIEIQMKKRKSLFNTIRLNQNVSLYGDIVLPRFHLPSISFINRHQSTSPKKIAQLNSMSGIKQPIQVIRLNNRNPNFKSLSPCFITKRFFNEPISKSLLSKPIIHKE